MNTIRLMIVDDMAETRDNIKRIVGLEEDIKIVGEATDGQEAVALAKKLLPDVILMDINMPVIDGIAATETISMEFPHTAIIIMSVQGEQEYLKKAMAAGAREYVVKPFSINDLINTVRHVYSLELKRRSTSANWEKTAIRREGRIVTVFSTKGGVGKSTIAVNLAVALAMEKGKKVALVDLDLQFGDVALMLNILPARTITELVQDLKGMDAAGLEKFLVNHQSGLKILPAPSRPEYAELINAEQVEKILNLLKENYDYIIVDTPPFFHDTNMIGLDMADQILLVAALDLSTIKNVKLSLEVFETLHLKEKTRLIVNRASGEIGIKLVDLESSLGFKSAWQIPSDGKQAITSINRGTPFIMASPGAKISNSIRKLKILVLENKGKQSDLIKIKKGGFFRRIFSS